MSTSPRKGATATRRPRNLLIEIGTAELPPKSLHALGQSLCDSVYQSLLDEGVITRHRDDHRFFAAPRRLAFWISQVAPRQPDREEERRGPAVAAAFDDSGAPTRAAQGFAGSCGVAVEDLDRLVTDKGEWLAYRQKIGGDDIENIVNRALELAVKQLPIARRMRWGSNTVEFVRPVRWLLAMYGSEPLKVSVLGLKAEPWTLGHRFHAPGRIRIRSADRYLETLRKDGHVIADYAERRATIERQINRIAKRQRAHAVIDPDLLNEVTGLVESPHAHYGEFDPQFLEVPQEVLVSSMSDHQKYFHLVDDDGNLLPGFITISNIRSGSPKRVRTGNERVLRARLADAEFFWNNDQKTPLEARAPSLQGVLFHNKLGSIADKVARMRQLAATIAAGIDADVALVDRASVLCKNDLVTDMVGEFPELQGTIGSYYAAREGEPEAVCNAIREHYQPRFAGDELPAHAVSGSLALADRIDSLVGIFATGEIPTGDKDPFGLRRSALGVLRILIEQSLDLNLRSLIDRAIGLYAASGLSGIAADEETADQVQSFVMERLRAYYQPLGYSSSEVSAVMAVAPQQPLDFHRRLLAVHGFYKSRTEAAEALAAANKRIANILAKQGKQITRAPDPSLYQDAAERNLADAAQARGAAASAHFAAGRYEDGLVELAALRDPVDQFFDEVMVMADDAAVRDNRLALLASIRGLFLEVADISTLRAGS